VTPELEQALRGAASVAYTEISNLAEDLSLPADEYPLAQIVEVLDDELCDLCAWLNGRIIRRGTPEWDRYRLPSHINCRRTFAYIPADAGEEPDFEEPPQSLIDKHGHFLRDPERYEELRVPAFADRRQFVFRRYTDPASGSVISTLQWLVDPEGAKEWWRDNLKLHDLFRYARIPQKLPRITVPRSDEDLVRQYRIYQDYYSNIYASIRAELARLDQLAQSATDINAVFEYSARAAAIRRAMHLVIQREIKDVLTLFRAPAPLRRLPPHAIVGATPDQEALIREAFEQALRYLPRGHNMPVVEIRIDLTRPRSFYGGRQIVLGNEFFDPRLPLTDRVRLICHEYAHHLEENNPNLLDTTRRLYLRQTTLPDGSLEPLQSLDSLYPGVGYRPAEMTRPDDFPHGYMGKWYEDGQGNQDATELLSQYYDYVFWKVGYIANHRLAEVDPAIIPQQPPPVEHDGYLDKMFGASMIDLTRELWRAWHRR
jgi:hypothetical protein